MEENDENIGDIVFPADAMEKEASRDAVRMILGGLGIFAVITVLGALLDFMNIYMLALQIVAPFLAVTGVFCWLITLYNGTRALHQVNVTEDGFDINSDHFAFDGLRMDFAYGKFLGKVRKFNSIYLDVRSKGYARKYWMGLYFDKTSFVMRDRLGKLIDHYEFDEKLINRV